MVSYMTFATKAKAKAYLKTMRGWPKKSTEQIYLPDDPTADKNGNVWVITPAPGMYLRQFGMVL